MPARRGKDALIEVLLNGTYVKIAGIRNPQVTISNSVVDVTTADSDGRFRELLEGGGITSVSVQGAGIFQGDGPAKQALLAAFTGAMLTARITIPGMCRLDAPWLVSNFQNGNDYTDATTFSATFENAGFVDVTLI
jgi:TP901-1 family phage major tail protein